MLYAAENYIFCVSLIKQPGTHPLGPWIPLVGCPQMPLAISLLCTPGVKMTRNHNMISRDKYGPLFAWVDKLPACWVDVLLICYIYDCGAQFPSACFSHQVKYWSKINVENSRGVAFAEKNKNCRNAPQHRAGLVILWCYLGFFGAISGRFGIMS